MGPFKVEAYGRVIDAWAYQHLRTAALMRDHVVDLESSAIEFGPDFEQIRSYCSACIMAAVASLEALINEQFLHEGGALRATIGDLEKDFWPRNGIERMPILSKYQLALERLGKPKFDESAEFFLAARALIELRNAITHFKPPWDENRQAPMDLVLALSGRYALSPLVDSGANFTGMSSMSAGCAAWAVGAAKTFMGEFDSRTRLSDKKMAMILGVQ